MMEAISQQTKIESTLDVAENLNNEETNLKLNVIDNLQNNDERVICDAEAEAEDDAEESSQGNDPEEDERSVPAEIQNSVEAPVNDESCVNLDDEDKDKENIVKEPSGLNNNDDSSDSIVETQIQEEHISDRTTKHESNNIDEDELLRSDDDEDQYDGKSPRTSRGRMHYIDISDDREEELLRSDDEDLEEKDKINNDDSLDIFSNDEENSCDVVMNKTDNVNEDVESQHEQQKESEDEDQYEHQVVENEDKSTKEREDDKEIVSISDEESILSQNEEESEKQIERDDQSCDESEQQIEREDKSCDEFDSEKQIERDDKSCDELDSEKQIERDDKSCDEFDSEKQIERDNKSCDENDSEKQIEAEDKSDNERDDVISLDDETIDDAKDIEEEDHKKEQTETEYITINEESLDTVENDENKVQLQRANTNSLENIVDVDENSLHSRQSNEESKKNVDQNLLNGDESSSDECRVKDIDEENESQSGFNIDNIKTEGHNHSGSPSGSLLEDESVLSRRISLENSISNDNSFVNRIKQQFKQENDDEMPKINGDHKLPETEEDTDTAVIDIQDNSLASIKINYSNHEMKKEMLSSDEEDDFESNLKIVDESNQFDNDLKDIDVDSNANEDIKPNIYSGGRIIENIKMSPTHETPGTIEDEASRSSMASSVSASSGTSSSHQLVIDHPIEDIEVLAVKSSKEPSKVKAPLKRKLSQTSDHSNTSSQHKQPHLEMEPETVEMKDSSALEVNYCNGDEKINDVRPEPESTTLLKLNNAPVATPENSEVSNEAQVSLSPARGSPLLNSLLTKLKQLPERSKKPKPIKSNQTKFLCFNCKTGSFNSLIALNEHQRVCLANKSLLPATIVSQTPPQSPVPQKMVSPSLDTNKTIEGIPLEKKRYYKCSSCDTYHENWNLFLHIREKHKRHMCLYCIRMFPTAEKLSLHLEIKHDLEQNHFNSEETLRKTIDIIQGVASESRFLMCCTCQHVFMENEPFSDHVCTLYMQACSLCGQKGRHSSQCKAQIEAKKSKVKRKNKDAMKLPNGSKTATVPIEACSNQPLLPISSCDKIPLQSKFPTPTSRISPSPLHQNEDSNSSCNMIIDETCNNTHYSSNARYNPFRALDERERQEQKVDVSEPDLPPDRSRSDQASEKPAPIQPLIVPKFKLRVPKEFQKSVDAAISSTESEEDDEIHEEDPDTSTEKQKNIATPSQKVDVEMKSVTEVYNSNGKPQSSKQNNNPDDEDSLDEPNSNLVRILQEIERTKMDIKRTKETLQSSKPLPATPRLATISQSSSRTGEQNWSPTPPASPNSQWFTPRRMVSQGESAEEMARKSEMDGSLLPSLPAQPPSFEQDRKDATGSDVDMDIDNTISAPSKQSIERSPKELDVNESQIPESVAEEGVTSKMETSTESNLENSDITNTTNESDEKTEKHTSVVPEPMELGEEQHKESPIEELSTGKTQDAQSSSTEKVILSKSSPPTHIEPPDNKEEKDIDVCDKQDDLSLRKKLPEDGIEVADEEIVPVELQLDRPLEKFEIVEFVRICLKAVYPLCLYCNHARRIAVNGKSLVLHLISQHRFVATVDSITAEELKPETIVAKFKSYLPDLKEHYFNSNSYCTMGNGAFTHPTNERIFECFQCRFVTSTHKELYLHNRKMHLKTAILCFMCRANFFSFSEILCHVCPGEPNKVSVFDVKFRCCLCELDNIPSPFRLMVHLRKKHFACDVCLEDCRDQGRLSSHVWKHKLHHLCYRCGIAYRNKMDITKHLFWKHGTESIICKRCLQKRWRHVYHFCVPPTTFVCDVCNLCFSKATYLKVHKRIHTGDLRYPCADENCDQKFISRRLLLKHSEEDHPPEVLKPVAQEPEKSETEPGKNTVVKDEENIKIKEENVDGDVESVKKSESNVGEKKETNPELDDKSEVPKEEKKTEEAAGTGKIRKKKKSKRSKESLEDLNLIAPNLSESDSSDDSDVECKSKSGDDALVPKVMLSPPSEHEQDKEDEKDTPETGKVLEIWQNFIQATGGVAATPALEKPEADYTEDYYPTPNLLHVVQSDHDYCMMFKPAPPVSLQENLPEPSPVKRKSAKSPRRSSTRRSNASSSSSGSSSSSDSSCSCGSNCSCSSSNSNSSSSSSSSDDSGDSSAASNTSKKRHRKKSERDRMRKKSESASPMKKHNLSETAKNEDDDVNVGTDDPPPNASALPNEPLFQESDLETAESDTDEEFYDEHPQKLASELLAQKRAQLMAQTRLSPSHNYDIVENSRPSTPSLPDEVAREKKVKLKKKKRDRKSTSRSAAGVQGSKLHFGKSPTALQSHQSSTGEMSVQPQAPIHSHRDYKRASPSRVERGTSLIQKPAAGAFPAIHAMTHQLTPRPIGPHHMGRMSEGSSCSDADASLKRSKRARRPNKFYGYTSDDENMVSGLGQPVMIGMRAIKPQPPPQLTWRKEDLPTPSKSILNNKNKVPRTPKTPNSLNVSGGGLFDSSMGATSTLKKKRMRGAPLQAGEKVGRKRMSKKQPKLPPIPTLKIRPSQIGLPQPNAIPTGTNHIPASQIYSSSKESDDDDDEEDTTDSTSDEETEQLLLNSAEPSTSKSNMWGAAPAAAPPSQAPVVFQASLVLPPVAPAPPTPQASAFNQKIPPALLPNPNFATLQYFKANNIRYPIRPPAGARQAREGESVYCYCRCPYDEVSEMIACDGENCLIEWFHFECVGIMVAPQGKWFCAECRPKYSEELYPSGKA